MQFHVSAKDIDVEFGIGGESDPLTLILGPCVIEGRDFLFSHAERIIELRRKFSQFNFIFKSSFDKANRTSLSNFRGPGIEEGLEILADLRKHFQIPVITDVHSELDVEKVSKFVDIVQIPAFLCRQTDLLLAAGKHAKCVMIKKGQFLHPEDMKFAALKVNEGGCRSVLLCERGSCFGYRDLVVDFRSLMIMRELGYPVVFDATHSVQNMGGAGGKSSGNRQYVAPLTRAAVAFGVDALFLECHENPDKAPSDGPNMIKFDELESLLSQISAISNVF
jgi:2-dehydro-3-deoxyphosphooctonate aldolase (KDO 8-P synthase)